ncbi:glycosyltransferase [Humitalea sp. 24SJ18S-53]|uniref:glycosyltransferase n=1 Tax=Humitalea sp. 24SJ18S-53 TaxID=3422307 RepID=UPI003D664FD1
MATRVDAREMEDPQLAACVAGLAADPGNSGRHVALGRLLLERSAYGRARIALTDAIALGHHDAEAHVLLGNIHRMSGAFLTEARTFDTAARMSGGHDEWEFRAAAAYCNAGLPDLAMQRFARVRRVLPDWWAGERARAEGMLAAAHATLRRLMPALRPGRMSAGEVATLIIALTSVGRLGWAERLADWGEARFEGHGSVLFARMRLVYRQGDPEAALRLLARHPVTHPATQAIVEFASKLAMDCGDPDRASAYLERWPRARWSHGTWIQACRIRMVAEDPDGLIALSRSWMGLGPSFDSMPHRFWLEAVRAAGRLPFLAKEDARRPSGGLGVMQFWDAPTPPDDVAVALASWRAVNPDVPHTVLHLDSARDFIGGAYGDVALRVFDRCHHAAMKADYLRLLWLHTHGGLYVDADEHCVAPVDPLLNALEDSEIVVVLAGDSPGYFNNCLIGARPGSPLLAAAIAEVNERTLAAEANNTRLNIWNDTGPGLLTRTVIPNMMRAATPQRMRTVATLAPNLRDFARNDPDLAYKLTPSGNWRLS